MIPAGSDSSFMRVVQNRQAQPQWQQRCPSRPVHVLSPAYRPGKEAQRRGTLSQIVPSDLSGRGNTLLELSLVYG